MKKAIGVLLIFIASQLQATQIYIRNWGTTPVHISKAHAITPDQEISIDTNTVIQPGQSRQLKVIYNNIEITNFDKITISFTTDGYTREQEIYFPKESDQEATLSFSDSGYKRMPYNIIKK